MQFSTLLAALPVLFALQSLAQDLSGLPTCAQAPTLQSIGSSGCQLTDIKCICSNQNFINSLEPVIQKACSPADLAKVTQFTNSLCGSVGVSIAAPGASSAAASMASSAAMSVSATGASMASASASASAATSKASAASASSMGSAASMAASSTASAAKSSSSSAADGGQAALLREGAISWCISAIFVGAGGAWVLRGL